MPEYNCKVRDAGAAIEHCKVARVDRDGAAAGQLVAQEHEVVDTLDVAIPLVGRTLDERLWVWVAFGCLAMKERELREELVVDVRPRAVTFELPKCRDKGAPLIRIILLLALLACTLFSTAWPVVHNGPFSLSVACNLLGTRFSRSARVQREFQRDTGIASDQLATGVVDTPRLS
eukprot:4123898-Prymnesium_polylepis.1